MSLFMETTKISAEQTVSEIQKVLGKYGAKSIQVEYEGGEVKAVAFIVMVGEQRLPFMLPARWEAVHDALYKNKTNAYEDSRVMERCAHAKRVAWRQILRWVEAQMAMVQTNMVKLEEVFMPYLVVDNKGQTLFQKLENSQFLLEGPKK